MPPKPTDKVLKLQINVIHSLLLLTFYTSLYALSQGLENKLLSLKLLLPTPAFLSNNLLRGFPVQQLASQSRKYPALGHIKYCLNPNILPKAHKTNGKPGSSAAHHPYSRTVQPVMQVEDSACLERQLLETKGGPRPSLGGERAGTAPGLIPTAGRETLTTPTATKATPLPESHSQG